MSFLTNSNLQHYNGELIWSHI
ncbi:hypothetical protein ACVNPZ_07065 [Staphylococcus aureus]